MIDSSLAKQLLQPFMNLPELNIMIADGNGYILAASNLSAPDSYHHSAHRLFLSADTYSLRLLDTAQDMPVYEAIHVIHNGEMRIGTVIAAGLGKDILGTVTAAAIAMEMLLAKVQTKKLKEASPDKALRFHHKLLGSSPAGKKDLDMLAAELGFKTNIIRVAILIEVTDSAIDGKEAVSQIKLGPVYNRQDIMIFLDEQHLLIFKAIDDTIQKAVGALKSILYEYIASLNRMPFLYTCKRTFFIGTMQNQLPYYQYSYGHAKWLRSYRPNGEESVVNFSDYILEYMESRIDPSEYRHVFQLYKPLFIDEDLEMFVHTVTALFENNMNLAKTASVIYLHRNTLTFRLNKIKDILNIDPVNSNQSRQWLHQLLHYYKIEKEKNGG